MRDIDEELDTWKSLSDVQSDISLKLGFIRWGARRLRQLAQKRMLDFASVVKEVENMNVPHFHTVYDALRYELKLEGLRDTLLALLIKRFGSVPATKRKRLENAEMDEVSLWFERLLDARNINEVFAERQPA